MDPNVLILISLIIAGGKELAKLGELLKDLQNGDPITPEMIAMIQAEREEATTNVLAALQNIIDSK